MAERMDADRPAPPPEPKWGDRTRSPDGERAGV